MLPQELVDQAYIVVQDQSVLCRPAVRFQNLSFDSQEASVMFLGKRKINNNMFVLR